MFSNYEHPHADLRELVERIDKPGQLKRVPNADPDLELGTLIELDELGFRVVSGATNSAQRLALTLGLPIPEHPLDVVRSYRERMKTHRLIPPTEVDGGSVLENIWRDDEVDIERIPAPLVLEGEMYPGELAPEGPFGEFTGYYAGGRSNQPVVRVRRVYHRNNPIMTVASPIRPPSNFSYSKCVMKSGMIWDEVERAGLSGVCGVWCHEAGAARLFNVISIKQAYAGHAKQAGLLAASCQSGSYLGRFVLVVDDDIDPTSMFDVLWAMSTRCDPAADIEIIRDAWSGPLDPRIPNGTTTNSRAIISAVRPFGRKFPPVAEASAELRAKVAAKYSELLGTLSAG